MEPRSLHNPFPGLRPFEPDEDHLFFGRETEIDDLLRRLGSHRFLSVIGTSGCGKSSLVRSGLIPSLQSGFMVRAGSSWRVAILRPGEDPSGTAATPDAPDDRWPGSGAGEHRVLKPRRAARSAGGSAKARAFLPTTTCSSWSISSSCSVPPQPAD
jgi:energy-coupling factor transporter ATP-binding protein EcfA2